MGAGDLRQVDVGGQAALLELGDLLGVQGVVQVVGHEVRVGRLGAGGRGHGQPSLAGDPVDLLDQLLGEGALGHLLPDLADLGRRERVVEPGQERPERQSHRRRPLGCASSRPFAGAWASPLIVSARAGFRRDFPNLPDRRPFAYTGTPGQLGPRGGRIGHVRRHDRGREGRGRRPGAAHRAPAGVSGQQVRVPGPLEAQPGDLRRREPQPRQGLQLRLHVLPGRSPERRRDPLRRDGPAHGGTRRHARPRHLRQALRRPGLRRRADPLRRLNDIAFSGDGEPTTFRNIDAIVGDAAEIKRRRGLDTVKMVLITNASMFHRPAVKKALETLDANQGEIWAKLDAGHRRLFPPDRPHSDPLPPHPEQPPRRRQAPPPGDPEPLHAGRRRRPLARPRSPPSASDWST